MKIGYALRQSLQKGYSLNKFKGDMIAAIIVGIVSLPIAMVISIAVGLPPQHGLYTAIVAGIAVPLLGGSIFQISGPTAAFIVIVAPIVSEHGLRGLIIATVIAGILLILMGIAKLGRYVSYVPYPVTIGFTSGIAVVIATLALNDLLGLRIEKFHGSYAHKLHLIVEYIPTFRWYEALVSAVSLLAMLVSKRILPKVPTPIAGITVGAILACYLKGIGFDIATIGNRFTFQTHDGLTVPGIPPFLPALHWPDFNVGSMFAWPSYTEVSVLIVPALAITALAALESLISAVVTDGIAGTKHNPNSELFGVGVGNILTGLAAGIPATAAVGRSVLSINSGAVTPVASSMQGAVIMLCVFLLAPMMAHIPMASLAALLMTVAYSMLDYRQLIHALQIEPWRDTIVLLVCFALTVFIDMIAGVTAGVVFACILFKKHITASTHTKISKIKNLPEDAMVYHITGAIFFGTAERVLGSTNFIQKPIRTSIIDMENVPLIDMTGVVAMKIMIADIHSRNIQVILCGSKKVTGQILQKLPFDSRHKVKVVQSVARAVKLVTKHPI